MGTRSEKAIASDPTIDVGTVIGGKYTIDALLAQGGMSFVYVARDSSLDERVAIKVLKREFRERNDVLARFVREAKTIRRIQSDHCVKVLEVGLDSDHGPFMVMEFLEGTNLRDILDSTGKLLPRRACELVVQVCDALAAAHANDCVHRDIKPDNIIVLRTGELEGVRVLDFGISKHSLTGSVLNHDLSLVSTMSLMGTPLYMSPEQMRSTAGTDGRTDIWAVGAMLYEMLTGRPPFFSESITELCSMVLEDEAAPVSLLEPSVPEALARVVHKCLQKKPADRYQNVGELALELMPFTPRRTRASIERILSVLAAAGVEVDRSALSVAPPGAGATPLVVPANSPLPRLSGVQPIGTPPAPARGVSTALGATHPAGAIVRPSSPLLAPGPVVSDVPSIPTAAPPRKMPTMLRASALVASVAFVLVLVTLLLVARRKSDGPTTVALDIAPPPAVPSPPASAVTVLEPAGSAEPPPSDPRTAPATKASASAQAAPMPGARSGWPPKITPAGTSTPKALPASASSAAVVAAPSTTSKVRVLDVPPSRLKVLD